MSQDCCSSPQELSHNDCLKASTCDMYGANGSHMLVFISMKRIIVPNEL